MKIIAQTTKRSLLIILEMIFGMLVMGAAFILVPISIFSIDAELLSNGAVWAFVIGFMLFFGSVGFFGFVRPFFRFRKLPQVQAETDGTYLYIHGPKEAKIPLAKMEGTFADAHLPYILTREFVMHLFSDRYGTVIIKVPGYGKYKLYYIADAREVPQQLVDLIGSKL